MKHGVVTEFKGEHFFLSNFYQVPFMWRDIKFKSGEQAFSWAKGLAAEPEEFDRHRKDVLKALSPSKAKYEGRRVKIDVAKWDAMKVDIMTEIVHARFSEDLSGQNLAGRLLDTGAMMLVEGNDWNDTFWGRCNGKGLNTLGSILMSERGYLRGLQDAPKAARYIVPPRHPDND